jgi:hypothetical protein
MAAIRPVLFHWRAKDEVRALSRDVRVKLGTALMALQRGFNLAMPLSRPMPEVPTAVEVRAPCTLTVPPAPSA